MKLSEYKQDYYQYTALASSTSRQLAFAGIALVWIFKVQKSGEYFLPDALLIPSIFLIVSLGADLLQYISGSIIWGVFHRHHERKRKSISEDPELEAPFFFPWPLIFFFYSKIASTLIAYGFLLNLY